METFSQSQHSSSFIKSCCSFSFFQLVGSECGGHWQQDWTSNGKRPFSTSYVKSLMFPHCARCLRCYVTQRPVWSPAATSPPSASISTVFYFLLHYICKKHKFAFITWTLCTADEIFNMKLQMRKNASFSAQPSCTCWYVNQRTEELPALSRFGSISSGSLAAWCGPRFTRYPPTPTHHHRPYPSVFAYT